MLVEHRQLGLGAIDAVEHLDAVGAPQRQDQGQVLAFQGVAVQVQRAVAGLFLAEVLEQARQVVQGGVADLAGQQLQYVIVLLDLQQVAAVRGAGEAGQGVAEQFLDPLGDGLGAVAAEAAYLQAWPAAVGRQRVEVVAQAVKQGVGAFVAADHQLVPAVQADLVEGQHQILAHAGIAQ